jgi:hypothetical protein
MGQRKSGTRIAVADASDAGHLGPLLRLAKPQPRIPDVLVEQYSPACAAASDASPTKANDNGPHHPLA